MKPLKLDSFNYVDVEKTEVYIEYDGWHFEGKPEEAVNGLITYILNDEV